MNRIHALILVALGAAAVAATAASGAGGSAAVLRGSIDLVDKQWVCSGPVDLDSVTVTMSAGGSTSLRGGGNDDAVHLHDGCTGRIGKITIVQYHGDAIKLGEGAHDLTIGSGSIRCLGRDDGKHQDGIQVMGGRNVLFRGLDVRCPTANNAAFFVNQGTNSDEAPTDVVCDGCFLSGGGITVRIYGSVRSGVRNSQIVAGHLSPFRVSKDSAVDPVNTGNTILPVGYDGGPTGGGGEPAPTAARAPRVSVLAPPATAAAAVRHSGAVATFSAQVKVNRKATLRVTLVTPAGRALPLLSRSRVGASVSGRLHTAIYAKAGARASIPILLRVPDARLARGTTYRLLVAATSGSKTRTATIRYRR